MRVSVASELWGKLLIVPFKLGARLMMRENDYTYRIVDKTPINEKEPVSKYKWLLSEVKMGYVLQPD